MNLQKSLRSVGVRTWLKLTGVLALIGGLAIFTGAEEGSPAQEQKYTFYMVVDRSIAYPEAWTDLLRGVREVDEVHADLDVIYLETGDYRECLALVEKVIWLDHPKPDGLIIATAPYEYHPLSPLLDLLDLAIKKGIHVTMIGLIPPYYLQKRFFEINWIGEDSYQAGMMAAEELQKRFTPSTVFVVVSPQRGDWGRLAGFQRVIEKPVESFIVNPTDVTSIDPLLFKLREEIEPVVFIATPDHRFTERFIQLAKELEIKLGPGGVRLVQAGAPFEKVLIYILDKIIVAAIDQQWYLQGHLAVEGMYSYVKYGIRRPFVTTQEIVTEETIRTPIVLEAEPQNQLIPWGDPLGLLLAEAKGKPIRVISNPCSCRPNPSFEISNPVEKNKLAEFFKDLPRTDPPAQVLYGGFVIFNPAIDPRIPGYAHVARGLIQMPKLIGGKTEYVYYKDIHGLEKWLEELYKQEFINCNQSSAPLDAESTLSQHEPESTSLLAQQQQLPTSGAEPPYEPQRWNIPVATPLSTRNIQEGKQL